MNVSVKSGVTTEEGDFGLFWLRSLIRSAEVGVRLPVALDSWVPKEKGRIRVLIR
jgi:hypothetical protein